MAVNCKIYTPDKWVSILLDEVEYKTNLWGKRVLENSCGSGNILKQIVERYIVDAKKNSRSIDEIKCGLERDITGIEIDPKACGVCKRRLTIVAKKHGISGVQWNVKQLDALTFSESNYSYVIGNPPYITYHDLAPEVREDVRNRFDSCKKGRFDYCYAFIEQSITNMQPNGRLAYIVPNSILKNVWAEDLRLLIRPYLRKIVDLKNRNVFEDVTISPIILIAEKKNNESSTPAIYQCVEEKVTLSFDVQQIDSTAWALGEYKTKSKLRFGDYFTVANSIATLFNDAFLIRQYTDAGDYISANGKLIEKALLKPAVSIKTLRAEQQPMIIFPYDYDDEDGIIHFQEQELRNRFPNAVAYLESFRKELNSRTADKTAKWFEYGRSQAIGHLNVEKLVMSTIVSGDIVIACADKDAVPYAGLYIVSKGSLPLSKAKEILEKDDFKTYSQQHGVPTAKNSYRISKKIVEAYLFEL